MPGVDRVRDGLDRIADRDPPCRRPLEREFQQPPPDPDALVPGLDEERRQVAGVAPNEHGRVAHDPAVGLGDEAPLTVMAHQVTERRGDGIDRRRRPGEAVALEQLTLRGEKDRVLALDIGHGRRSVLARRNGRSATVVLPSAVMLRFR